MADVVLALREKHTSCLPPCGVTAHPFPFHKSSLETAFQYKLKAEKHKIIFLSEALAALPLLIEGHLHSNSLLPSWKARKYSFNGFVAPYLT